MSEAQYIQFLRRLKRIDRYHRRLARGYVTSVNEDGLIIARPRRSSSGLPLRGVFFCLLTLLMFKAFLLARLGDEGYARHLAVLENGTPMERAGAFVMRPDPVTTGLAAVFAPLF